MLLPLYVLAAFLTVACGKAVNHSTAAPKYLQPYIDEVPDPRIFIDADHKVFESLGDEWQDVFRGLEDWSGTGYDELFIDTVKLKKGLICKSCNVAVGLIIWYQNTGLPNSVVASAIIGVCTGLNLYSFKTCKGVVHSFLPELNYIIQHRSLEAGSVCGMALQSFNCNEDVHHKPSLQWTVEVDLGKPPKNPLPDEEKPTYMKKVLHLADFHYDPEYRVGYNTECKEPICCREGSGKPFLLDNIKSGYWGEYDKCDIPYHTLANTLKHIRDTHKDIDMIIMTGDLPPHNVWDTSKEQSLDILRNTSNALRKYLPNITTIPCLGNHESHPTNSFPHSYIRNSEFSVQWLYNGAAKAWSRWLPEDALTTVRKAGYFSHSPAPGLRILSINTNMCYTLNFWLLYDSKDPEGILSWMAYQLLEAEQKGEAVYVVGHVPPGNSDCWSVWSREYRKLIKRFSNTIKGQFFSHTHHDDFKVFVDSDHTTPYSVMYLGGSVTTYQNLNPAYRIYTVNAKTWTILNFETWTYNLASANKNRGRTDPRWYKLYSAKNLFRLSSLSPHQWYKFARRLRSDEGAYGDYRKAYWRNAQPGLDKPCDEDCKNKMICNLLTTNWADQRACS